MLHPYYKLAYIKLAWGGAEEQAEQVAVGYPNAKNWQDEARKVLETKVFVVYLPQLMLTSDTTSIVDGGILEDLAKGRTNNHHWQYSSRRITQR